jgi:FemAB-related protein (PEP-CTERM system-associated)
MPGDAFSSSVAPASKRVPPASPEAAPPLSGRVGEVFVSKDITERQWDDYVNRHPDATADHLWNWRHIFDQVFRHESQYLVARRGGAVSGVLPLVLFRSRLFGRFAVSVPFLNYGGVLADDAESAQALVAAARTTALTFGAQHLELRHQRRTMAELPCRQHKLGFSRPLPASGAELWTQIDRKIRNQVRKAQKEGLTVTAGGAELTDDFYVVFAQNMRDLGTPVYSRRLFSETLRLFPDRARVFTVRQQDRILAAAITLTFRDTVLVPWASSLRDARHLCPNTLLYWTMLEHAANSGARVFDFGRSSPGGGVNQFKLQWGATPRPLHWEYVLLRRTEVPDQGPSNPKFQTAIRAWQWLPIWVANGLGPHIVRSIP